MKSLTMNDLIVSDEVLPGLFQSADQASQKAQSAYYNWLRSYLILLIAATIVPFFWPRDQYAAIGSTMLFLITLAILIFLRVKRPDHVWYNGRAVAESVKTRAWRWMMKAEPYQDCSDVEAVSKHFISDLKAILSQNHSLSEVFETNVGVQDPISEVMAGIRSKTVEERFEIYKQQRIDNQSQWYAQKSVHNKNRARQWFCLSVALHCTAIVLLLYRIFNPTISLPIEVIATAATAALTWLQAKKHNEQNSSYALAAHEIVLLKGEALSVNTEKDLSEFVLNSESAFSREHTQWVARKLD